MGFRNFKTNQDEKFFKALELAGKISITLPQWIQIIDTEKEINTVYCILQNFEQIAFKIRTFCTDD